MPGRNRRPVEQADPEDDFSRLGTAVARVLREAFSAAEQARASGNADARAIAAQAEAEAVGYVHAAKDIPSKARHQADHLLSQLHQAAARLPAEHSVDDAALRRAEEEAKEIVERALEVERQSLRRVEDMLVEAQARAAAMRQQALADSRTIVEQAEQRLATATDAVEQHRTQLAEETKRIVGQLRATVARAQDEMALERTGVLQRAEDEANAIVQQARLHHAAAAREALRMVDSAVKQSADLREMAVQDGMAITAKARQVADRLMQEAADNRTRRLGSLAPEAQHAVPAPASAPPPHRARRPVAARPA